MHTHIHMYDLGITAYSLIQEEMSLLEEKFGAKKKTGEEEEIKDVENKTTLHSKQAYVISMTSFK